MDQDLYDKGMKIRREVLGDAYVDRALSKSGPFNDPLQELVTTYCWGWCWGREGLAAARPQPDQPGDDRGAQPAHTI
jgi:4-carboxymuconolactone decarboxylase